MNDILTDLGISRAKRREFIREQKKRLRPLEFIERTDLADIMPSWCSRCLVSGKYWIQEKQEQDGWIRAMIGRHDKRICGDWNTLQSIKNIVYGEYRWAVQAFPPISELVNTANIYWLMIAPVVWEPDWLIKIEIQEVK